MRYANRCDREGEFDVMVCSEGFERVGYDHRYNNNNNNKITCCCPCSRSPPFKGLFVEVELVLKDHLGLDVTANSVQIRRVHLISNAEYKISWHEMDV